MIKNLIFDFGGVLIPISEHKTKLAFQELGASDELRNNMEIFHQYEKGEISTTEFEKGLQAFLFRKVFLKDIGVAWNALIDTPLPENSVELLQKLKKKYRLFLLSNTNELHINAIKKEAGLFKYKQFTRQFEKIYYSFEVGMRKPDREIFDLVLEENDLKVEETFYIEDSNSHIQTAGEIGLKYWEFDPASDDINDLDKVLSKLH